MSEGYSGVPIIQNINISACAAEADAHRADISAHETNTNRQPEQSTGIYLILSKTVRIMLQ